MRARDIMVVEDDPDVRAALVEMLSDEGYPTRAAANGAEALTELAREAPQLIVLDLMMPVMDGWAFRARQLARPEWAQIPVIVMSAMTGTDYTASLGADAYLPKPAFAERVLGVIGALYRPASSCPSCGRAVMPRGYQTAAFCPECLDESTDPERDVGGED
ncbi:MAG: response regulator [Kofleriaceae bacterium]